MRLDFDPAGVKPPHVTPLIVVNAEEISASLSFGTGPTGSRNAVSEGHGSDGLRD